MEGGEIEGDRQKTAVDVSHHPVLVIPPAGEAGEVIKDPTLRGVEDMRAVFMNENPVLVKAVIGVAAHMAAALQHQDPPGRPALPSPGRPPNRRSLSR